MLEKILNSIFLFLLLATPLYAQKSPFQISYPPSSFLLRPGIPQTIQLDIAIPPDYFVYQEKTKLSFLDLKGLEVKNIQYPPSKTRQDPFFKRTMDVFEGNIAIGVIFAAPPDLTPGPMTVEALLTLQGCSDVLCYPEETHLISFSFDIAGGGGTISSTSRLGRSLSELLSAQRFETILQHQWWVVLLVVFLGGFLTSLTPCVLPVIPITLMIIGVRAESPVRRNFLLSAVLVLGLSLMYALLGVLAVSLGKGLGFVFQQKWLVILLGVGFFLLALSMFGLFEIHLPQRLTGRLQRIQGHGFWGAFLSGAAAGILATPCAGPVMGALLLYVAATQSYSQGFGLLFIYALGMGILFIVLGTGYGTLQARFKSYRFTVWIKKFLGVLLLLASLFYLNTVFPLQKTYEKLLTKPSPVAWLESESQGLTKAMQENKVMLIDFYADWCPPCKELELGFFRKPEVVALLEQMVPVRVDATFINEEVARVLKKYQVVGWPTVVFVHPDGKILDHLTIVSYHPELLLENMRQARDTATSRPLP